MRNLIVLKEGREGWKAHYWSGPLREVVLREFGVDLLPTAFTLDAAPANVLREIRARNPDCEVALRPPTS
jgi:hypothetical protein